MYHQAWPWGGTASASPTSGYVQPPASTQVATTQWPAGYSQYAVSPEIQQQWAAAWASQAQYAYGSNVPVGESQTAAYTGAYPDYQTAANTVVTASETKKSDDANSASDKPKNSAEQPLSQDLAESDKIKQLKEQAEKWTSLQQPAASWSLSTANTASSIDHPTTVTAPNDATKSLTSTNVTQSGVAQGQMSKEEEEFERQFKDWEKQFESWKQQNQNHPDKEAFAQYEKQWQKWRAELLQNKEQMQKAKAEQNASLQSSASGNAAAFVSTQSNSTNITDSAAATSTAGMYYQHPQYMYMQPYMYPGAAAVAPVTVPPAVVPQAVVPPAVVPPAMVPPTGVPPVSMQPGAIPPPQQMPFNVPPGPPNSSYGNQPPVGMAAPPHNEMNYDNQRPPDFENDRGMYNYGPMQGNGPGDDNVGPNFEGFENPNMNMPEGDFPRDNWKFGRGGRGRGGGRGRARGRGSRWSEPTDMEVRPPPVNARPQRKTLLPGGPGTFPPEENDPPPFEYPTEDCRDQFKEDSFPPDRHGNRPRDERFDFRDGPRQYPPDDGFASQPFDEHFPPDHNQYPPDQEFPDQFPPDQRFPPDHKRFPPGEERFPPDEERFPPGREGFPPGREGFPPGREGFPPGREGFPPGREGFPPGPGREGFPPGPGREGFPPGHEGGFPAGREGREGFPPGREGFPRGQDRFPPDHERFSHDRFPPEEECFPPDQERFPPGQERFPPKGGRFPPGNRFPPEDERFPPEDERFPPGPEGFPPPRRMMDEGGFREFDQYPPDDEMYGPPPFRDEFPPFDERGSRGRGRFPGRGGRRFRGEFDRFGPPFPPRINESFGSQDFPPPDDRFDFPNDGPPRMPPPRGRPPFEPPPFGPEGRFPDEPAFFGDGPQRFKSIDYTHRPAAAVMGDDYNPNYEFESEFQDDVNAYRARPPKRKKRDTQRKSTVEKKKDTDTDKDKDNENPKDKANDD